MDILSGLSDYASDLWARVKRNPVAVSYLITAVVGVAARYGFDLDPELVAVVLGVTGTGAAVVARSKVTPG